MITLVSSALNVEGITKGVRRATPEPGADTTGVLRSIGYSDREIDELRGKGVI